MQLLPRGSAWLALLPKGHGQVGKRASLLSTQAALRKVDFLEDRDWLLKSPYTKTKHIQTNLTGQSSFLLLQDDLLHPILGGNKLRKLDALMPHLAAAGVTDVSAHTAAVACACAEQGISAHLLVRGERPAVPTGYHLLTLMYGHVTYVPRSQYSNRAATFLKAAEALQLQKPAAKEAKLSFADHEVGESRPHLWQVFELAEGAADPLALLGLIRLVQHLATCGQIPSTEPVSIIIDSGTGTTAIGVAIGIALFQLPWNVVGLCLAGPECYYQQQQADLTAAFLRDYGSQVQTGAVDQLSLAWIQRIRPRKFGNVLPEEIAACSQIAKQHGVLLDPIYSLAAWEMAERLTQRTLAARQQGPTPGTIVMLHTGGAFGGLHGLAQRYPACF